MNKLKNTAFVFVSLLFCCSCGGGSATSETNYKTEKSVNEKYPMPWKDATKDEFISIGRALIKNNVTGCGIYYIRPSSENSYEYLVGCSEDGESWLYYLVWVHSKDVMGPYVDNTIKKPELK